jgi:arylsulfatase A-like enzyme
MDAHAPYLAPYPFNPIGYSFFKKAMQKVKRLSKKDLVSQEVTGYKREIEYLDSKLGTLFTLLKRKGIYNEALIVITSDHGELFGEHGYTLHNCPMFEGVIKVPLVIKYPFNSRTGRITQPITLSDLFSTILSICDLPIPQNVSGIPFGSALQPVVSEWYEQEVGAHRTLRLGDYKFMHYEKGKDSELYHVKEDSRELKNLMQKKPDIAREYENLLEDWLQQHTPQYTESKTMKFIVPQETIEGLRDLGYIE